MSFLVSVSTDQGISVDCIQRVIFCCCSTLFNFFPLEISSFCRLDCFEVMKDPCLWLT